MFKVILISVVSLAVLVNSAPQSFPQPPMPPGMPAPPSMLKEFIAEKLVRIARQAPPSEKDASPPPSLNRVARQAPTDAPKSSLNRNVRQAPKRVARHIMLESADEPKQIKQEAFYSSVTTINREKRETTRG
ncbi:hypothetical protein PVAND_001531 [Polypedilum vanderplanki]|uniref:Secreted protein n=1 Tax=Polypedilum vanderplanki TaxID=319348 RepID=A0A9J6BNP9_POLVA|nr:hypothetical protein PVAND_001531 [Polypedilum vanderplanki]